MIDLGDGDAIHLTGYNATNANSPAPFAQLQFADGSVMTYEEVIEQGFDINGTDSTGGPGGPGGLDGADDITGTAFKDRINGKGGNDRLTGLGGDDTLAGGTEMDILAGGSGNDTYLFNQGDGTDTVIDVDGTDRIVLGAGLTRADLTFSQFLYEDGKTYASLKWDNASTSGTSGTGEADELLIEGGLAGSARQISFADGSSVTLDELAQQSPGWNITGTNTGETLYGSLGMDSISAGGGNDTVYGLADADRIDGGSGDDTLAGGEGADTYVFGYGSGRDTVNDSGGTIELTQDVALTDLAATVLAGGLGSLGGLNAGAVEIRLISGERMTLLNGAVNSQAWQIKDANGATLTLDALIAASQGGSGNPGTSDAALRLWQQQRVRADVRAELAHDGYSYLGGSLAGGDSWQRTQISGGESYTSTVTDNYQLQFTTGSYTNQARETRSTDVTASSSGSSTVQVITARAPGGGGGRLSMNGGGAASSSNRPVYQSITGGFSGVSVPFGQGTGITFVDAGSGNVTGLWMGAPGSSTGNTFGIPAGAITSRTVYSYSQTTATEHVIESLTGSDDATSPDTIWAGLHTTVAAGDGDDWIRGYQYGPFTDWASKSPDAIGGLLLGGARRASRSASCSCGKAAKSPRSASARARMVNRLAIPTSADVNTSQLACGIFTFTQHRRADRLLSKACMVHRRTRRTAHRMTQNGRWKPAANAQVTHCKWPQMRSGSASCPVIVRGMACTNDLGRLA